VLLLVGRFSSTSEGGKGTEGIMEIEKADNGWKYGRNHPPLNFNGPFPLVLMRSFALRTLHLIFPP
jgi:hypothetical protein